MATVEESIEVDVDVTTAYNQWTQFEEFPRFMEGVKEVRQLDDTHLHWVAEIGGETEEWQAEISDQQPDQRIAWRSTSGKQNDGAVTFQPIDANRTRVTVKIDYEPEGVKQSIGGAVGADDRQVKNDLERFKQMIEGRGQETGAWRGEVQGGERVDTGA